MLAGISLVKAGERSVDLIEKAAETGRLTPDVVRLLADIGGSRSRALLSELSGEAGPVGTAARESTSGARSDRGPGRRLRIRRPGIYTERSALGGFDGRGCS